MREVIQKVVETEEEARRIVAVAKGEAEQVVLKAHQKARNLEGQTQQDLRAEAERIMAEAIQAAEQEKKEQLDRLAVEMENQVRLEEMDKQHAVDAALRYICLRP